MNQANQAKKIMWRKKSGKMVLKDKRIVKTGDEFLASLDEIPLAFRDNTVPVNPADLEELSVPKIDLNPSDYTVKSCGPGRYNILDGQGKVINEKPLSKVEADGLVESLGG